MEVWQIITTIIAILAFMGAIIWRFAALEIKIKDLPHTMSDMKERLSAVEARVNDIFDIFLEDGRSRRRDLREYHSAPKLTKAANDLIPDDVKKSITRKRMESNNCLPGREIVSQLKQELTLDRLSQDATERGLGLQEWIAILADYDEEES